MNRCRLCGTMRVTELLDCGMQPVCNRFLLNPAEAEYKHHMVFGQCESCGLVQITNPVPAGEILPHFDWITYSEPEGHLDQLAEIICSLSGLTRESTICGISFKDDSILTRLSEKGFKHIWRIDPESDLRINDKRAGVETIQSRLTPEVSRMITQKHGTSDVVILRHIFEHAHDVGRFMKSIKQLVSSGGYIILEVPDRTQAMVNHDYTTLWEEHILYFTPETFRHCLSFGGFSLVRLESYPYPLENSLVGIVQSHEEVTPFPPSEIVLEKEKYRARAYLKELPEYRTKFKKFFLKYKQNHGKIALFGAGHLGCAFINLLELKDCIEFVVDNNPNKQGMFMPGSRLPICDSGALLEKDIKLCLLSVAPEKEDKVIQNNRNFLKHGGTFSSIFPGSKYAMQM